MWGTFVARLGEEGRTWERMHLTPYMGGENRLTTAALKCEWDVDAAHTQQTSKPGAKAGRHSYESNRQKREETGTGLRENPHHKYVGYWELHKAPCGSAPTAFLKVGAVTPLLQARKLASRGDGPSQKGTQLARRETETQAQDLGHLHPRLHSVVSDSCDPMNCSPPGSFVHWISQARIREWVAISSSRGSFWPGIELHLLHWQAGSLSPSPQGSLEHLHQHCPTADLEKGSAIIYLAAPGKNLRGVLLEMLWFLLPPVHPGRQVRSKSSAGPSGHVCPGSSFPAQTQPRPFSASRSLLSCSTGRTPVLSSVRNALLGLLATGSFLLLQVSAQGSPPLQRNFLEAHLIWPSLLTFSAIARIASYRTPTLVCVWKSLSRVRLCDPMDYTVHGIIQARILEWVAFPFSRGSSQPGDRTQVSCIAGRFFTSWATREAQHLS